MFVCVSDNSFWKCFEVLQVSCGCKSCRILAQASGLERASSFLLLSFCVANYIGFQLLEFAPVGWVGQDRCLRFPAFRRLVGGHGGSSELTECCPSSQSVATAHGVCAPLTECGCSSRSVVATTACRESLRLTFVNKGETQEGCL